MYEMKVSEILRNRKNLCHNIYATSIEEIRIKIKGKTSINSQLTPQPLH